MAKRKAAKPSPKSAKKAKKAAPKKPKTKAVAASVKPKKKSKAKPAAAKPAAARSVGGKKKTKKGAKPVAKKTSPPAKAAAKKTKRPSTPAQPTERGRSHTAVLVAAHAAADAAVVAAESAAEVAIYIQDEAIDAAGVCVDAESVQVGVEEGPVAGESLGVTASSDEPVSVTASVVGVGLVPGVVTNTVEFSRPLPAQLTRSPVIKNGPITFQHAVLPNGLEVIAECNAQAHSAGVAFYVETGSRDETPDVNGVSHFLEHMVFKGTPKRSPEDVNREWDEMGAQYNAFTSEENTVYYAYVLPEHVEPAVELWSDVLRPALRAEDFNKEKNVILEEIGMYQDQPPYGADDKCRALHFNGHPLGSSVLGTRESVGALTPEAMRAYFEVRYSPRNIVLAAAGKVDFDQLVAAAEKYCGHWAPFEAPRKHSTPAFRPANLAIHKPASTQEYVLLMSPGPAAKDNDRYAAKVLATVLGDDTGSRFFWDLVDPGLAESCSLGHGEYVDCGVMLSFMACDPDQAASNIEMIREIYRSVEASGVTADELAQAKSKLCASIVLRSERPRGRLFSVAGNWTHRREYRTVQQDLDAIAALTLDDLAAVVRKWPLSQSTLVAIGPLENLGVA
jgi:predicted Zn-dependent peptidase